MNRMKSAVPRELHSLLSDFVRKYIDSSPPEFEQFGRNYFKELIKTGRSIELRQPEDSLRAVEIIKEDPVALYKYIECDPKILLLRDKLRYLVLSYLLEKPHDLKVHGEEYFSQLCAIKGYSAIDDLIISRRGGILGETYKPELYESNEELPFYEKTWQELRSLREKTKFAFLFKNLDDKQIDLILGAMFKLQVEKGTDVIRQGDNGDYFYVVEQGLFEAYVTDEKGHYNKLTTYDDSGSFGELALLYNMPRVATVVAVTDGVLWCLDRLSFKKVVVGSAYRKRDLYMHFLSKVTILQGLNEYEREALIDALEPMAFHDGECIIKQADEATGMYIIEAGTAVCSYQDENGKVTHTKEIHEGGYFGEVALLKSKPRAMSVHASGIVKVLFIDTNAFERLLGPCQDLMHRRVRDYSFAV